MPVARLEGRALGTGWRVRYAARASVDPARLVVAIDARLAAIAGEMSQWLPGSALSRFNRAPAGSWHALPPDFAHVVAAALDVARESGGAFDPTHGRAAALLGYGAEPFAGPPTDAALDDARAAAGWQRLVFEPAARRLCQPGGLWLDLSGIAKGFAVDAVADLLAAHGIADALVEIGGELAGRGLRPDGEPWWVEAETPPGSALPPLRLALHEAAVATSGDYVRGGHTLDPATGRPLAAPPAAVTVLAPNAMRADAWATALTVAGGEAALALAAAHALPARVVGQDGGEWLSPTLRALLDD